MQIVSIGDNLHKMSKPVFWENKKNILICCLLKILPRVQRLIPEYWDTLTPNCLLKFEQIHLLLVVSKMHEGRTMQTLIRCP